LEEVVMKAVCASFSAGKETWDRFKAKILHRVPVSRALSLRLEDMPEPIIPGPGWVKIRTIMSGISGLDEGMFLHGDMSALGAFVSFPFVPGNENIGIVTEIGPSVRGVEPGERVVLDPLLSCKPRGVQPPCPSCAAGDPSSCRSFASGAPGPGVVIGACRDTGGGWGDVFVAHSGQLRTVPHHMDSDQAVLIPEFTRALRAVLLHPPAPDDRVLIVGARSLGLLMLVALRILGLTSRVLVVAEQPLEAELARKLGNCVVTLLADPAETAELVAEFSGSKVRYPEAGPVWLEGGADLVYETTGAKENVDYALRFAGEHKKIVLAGLNQASGFDMSPVWFKGVEVKGTAFSGLDSYKGETRPTMDIALELASEHGLPAAELITHRFRLEEHASALATLQDRFTAKAAKVVFKNVM
jgi:threonine dehydrogenase-like Zn-dependent dehydrogenase